MTSRERRVQLLVRNSSVQERSGLVMTPWQPIAAAIGNAAAEVSVLDGDRRLPAQVDRIDPDDPSRDELVFRLDQPLAPGERTVSILNAASRREERAGAEALAMDDGIRLQSDDLRLWIQLGAERVGGSWFGGAVTSVQRERRDLLDATASEFRWTENREKRGMQIDRVRISPEHGLTEANTAPLFNRSWSAVSLSGGPLRAVATIASPPFEYATTAGESRVGALLRTISIEARGDVIRDDLRIKILGGREGAELQAAPLFVAGFFMSADFSLYAEIRRHPVEIADWFAIAAGVQPLQGYGFATDARVGKVWNPPADYPDAASAHRAFSWELGAAASARCIHLFRTGLSAGELADSVGRCWYEYLYEPLRATLLNE